MYDILLQIQVLSQTYFAWQQNWFQIRYYRAESIASKALYVFNHMEIKLNIHTCRLCYVVTSSGIVQFYLLRINKMTAFTKQCIYSCTCSARQNKWQSIRRVSSPRPLSRSFTVSCPASPPPCAAGDRACLPACGSSRIWPAIPSSRTALVRTLKHRETNMYTCVCHACRCIKRQGHRF